MRKLLMVAMILAFVGMTNAQEKKHNNFEEWSKALSLTDTQIAEIQAIKADHEKKVTAIRHTATKQDFKALNDERKQQIYNVLTPEQKEKDKQYQERKNEEKIQKAKMKSPSK